MGLVRCLAVAMLHVLIVSNLNASELKGRLWISPLVGLNIPVGDAADNDQSHEKARSAKPGIALGGALEYGLRESIVIGGNLNYNKFGFDDESMVAETDLSWTIIEIGAYVRVLLTTRGATRPYLRAGILTGKADIEGEIIVGEETRQGIVDISRSVGLEGGIGVLHIFSRRIGSFVEGTVTNLLTDGNRMESGTDDMIEQSETVGNYQWITIAGGITIFLGK